MGSPLCVPVNTSVENQLSLLLSAPLHGPSQHPPSSDPKCLWPAVSAHSIWWGGGASWKTHFPSGSCHRASRPRWLRGSQSTDTVRRSVLALEIDSSELFIKTISV